MTWWSDFFQQSTIDPSLKYVVAYSGGVDSHVLLHMLAEQCKENITAMHVNHGLQPEADSWQAHCEKVCRELNVPFQVIKVEVVKKPRHSLEALARDARYAALATCLDGHKILLTAHNQDDQAETILLQLMRGAGLRGLSGMPLKKTLVDSQHWRPLLDVSRDEIVQYALAHDLSWIEDSSNQDLLFDRNFLRHDILPALKSRREGVIASMVRSARHAAEAEELVNALAEMDYIEAKGSTAKELNIKALKALESSRQKNLLRYWLKELGAWLPSEAILEQIQAQLLGHHQPNAVIEYKNVKLSRTRDYLCFEQI